MATRHFSVIDHWGEHYDKNRKSVAIVYFDVIRVCSPVIMMFKKVNKRKENFKFDYGP